MIFLGLGRATHSNMEMVNLQAEKKPQSEERGF
jgi:hypothetical protein